MKVTLQTNPVYRTAVVLSGFVLVALLAACRKPSETTDSPPPTAQSTPHNIARPGTADDTAALLDRNVERWQTRLAELSKSPLIEDLEEAVAVGNRLLNLLGLEDLSTTPGMSAADRDRISRRIGQKLLAEHHTSLAVQKIFQARRRAEENERREREQQARSERNWRLRYHLLRRSTGDDLRDDPEHPTLERVVRFELRQREALNAIRRQIGLPIPENDYPDARQLAMVYAETPFSIASPLPPMSPFSQISDAHESPVSEDLRHDPSLPREEQVRRHQERLRLLLKEHRERQRAMLNAREEEGEVASQDMRPTSPVVTPRRPELMSRETPAPTDWVSDIEKGITDLRDQLVAARDNVASGSLSLEIQARTAEIDERVKAIQTTIDRQREEVERRRKEAKSPDDPNLEGEERLAALAAKQYAESAERYIARLEQQKRLVELEKDLLKALDALRSVENAALEISAAPAPEPAESDVRPPSAPPRRTPVRRTPVRRTPPARATPSRRPGPAAEAPAGTPDDTVDSPAAQRYSTLIREVDRLVVRQKQVEAQLRASDEATSKQAAHDPSLPRAEQIRRHKERLRRLLAEQRAVQARHDIENLRSELISKKDLYLSGKADEPAEPEQALGPRLAQLMDVAARTPDEDLKDDDLLTRKERNRRWQLRQLNEIAAYRTETAQKTVPPENDRPPLRLSRSEQMFADEIDRLYVEARSTALRLIAGTLDWESTPPSGEEYERVNEEVGSAKGRMRVLVTAREVLTTPPPEEQPAP